MSGVDELGADELGADVAGADVSEWSVEGTEGFGADVSGVDELGADEGPNESAQFVPAAQDLKLKLKKTPIICPGGGADSINTSTIRYLFSKAVANGWLIVRDDPEND